MSIRQKRLVRAFYNLSFVLAGNTVGIWFMYLVVLFFDKIIPNINWPGIDFFVQNGTFLIITFSLFTTALSYTISFKLFNKYSIFSIVGLFITSLNYMRFIGISVTENKMTLGVKFVQYFSLSCAVILLFFIFKNRKLIYTKKSWLKDAFKIDDCYDIFLSYAMSSNSNDLQRKSIENDINKIACQLKDLKYKKIFNASTAFHMKHDAQTPEMAAICDFNTIENSKNFILYYPENVPSSALVEFGYALREGVNIIIFVKSIENLPFLVREIKNIRIVIYKDIDHIVSIISENHRKYFV